MKIGAYTKYETLRESRHFATTNILVPMNLANLLRIIYRCCIRTTVPNADFSDKRPTATPVRTDTHSCQVTVLMVPSGYISVLYYCIYCFSNLCQLGNEKCVNQIDLMMSNRCDDVSPIGGSRHTSQSHGRITAFVQSA